MKQYLNENGGRVLFTLALCMLVGVGFLDPAAATVVGLALTTSTGMLGNGTTLAVSSGSPTSYTTVNNARNIEFDTGVSAKVDMTNLTSDWKEFLMGLPDPGSLTFELDYNIGDAGQAILRAARIARTRCDFRVVLPSGTTPTATMQGFVAKFPVTIGGVDNPVKTQVECFLTGPITLA